MNKKKRKKKRVIPGFGLSMGITMTILSLIVIIPIASLVIFSSQLDFADFIETITRQRVLYSYGVSLATSFIAALINAIMGLILAWVLVRYDFSGKRLLDGFIELPFALPTAVAGIALTALCVDTGWIGGFFAQFGIELAYTRVGITIALVFIGIPFVVRSVQPVLEKMEPIYEEAASVMGANNRIIFRKIIFPELKPALLTGFGLAFARRLGEYGSVVFIAGNKPYSTEIAPLTIMAKLQEYDYASATSIALVMLFMAFIILFVINIIQVRSNRITGGD